VKYKTSSEVVRLIETTGMSYAAAVRKQKANNIQPAKTNTVSMKVETATQTDSEPRTKEMATQTQDDHEAEMDMEEEVQSSTALSAQASTTSEHEELTKQPTTSAAEGFDILKNFEEHMKGAEGLTPEMYDTIAAKLKEVQKTEDAARAAQAQTTTTQSAKPSAPPTVKATPAQKKNIAGAKNKSTFSKRH